MSAVKIADALKRCIDDGSTDLVCVSEAAEMLLQQAEEIDALSKVLGILFKHRIEQEKEIEQLKNKKIIGLEGGQKSITIPIDIERELAYAHLPDKEYEQSYQFNLLKSEKQYYQSHTERLVGILDEKNAEIKKLKGNCQNENA